ncbi:MAG: stage III sporulation AC/AD family protein [Clostridia bacterium]|nr:stage III sporulation AC/AD family protein [Clostridia bacterium]
MTLRFFGIALLFGIVAFVLRGFGWRGAPIFALVAAITLMSEGIGRLSTLIDSLKMLGDEVGAEGAVRSALKVLGLGYLFGISADVCRDIGEPGIAKAVEVVGRVEIIAVVMPYFSEIIKAGVELIG